MVLEIVKYGDPVLRAKGKRIEEITEEIQRFAVDLTETMYAAHGLGLAAQQVGAALQITVVDVAQVQEERPSTMTVGGQRVELGDWMPLVLINPRLELSADRTDGNEGCLSFPEIHGEVPRASRITVHATRPSMAGNWSSRPRGCWRGRFSTRSITSTASSTSTG